MLYAPGAGASVEDCGMVSMQGADPDRPKVNQAGTNGLGDSECSSFSHHTGSWRTRNTWSIFPNLPREGL